MARSPQEAVSIAVTMTLTIAPHDPRTAVQVPRLVISCEHAGHRVPAAYCAAFAGAEPLLRTHRGWDPGALVLARQMAGALGAPLLCGHHHALAGRPEPVDGPQAAVFSHQPRAVDRQSNGHRQHPLPAVPRRGGGRHRWHHPEP